MAKGDTTKTPLRVSPRNPTRGGIILSNASERNRDGLLKVLGFMDSKTIVHFCDTYRQNKCKIAGLLYQDTQ